MLLLVLVVVHVLQPVKTHLPCCFTAAKVSHLAHLPQGQVEAKERAINMVNKMDELGFGNCTNTGDCEIQCPKGISLIILHL